MDRKSVLPIASLLLFASAGVLGAQLRSPIQHRELELSPAPAVSKKTSSEDLYFYTGERGEIRVPLEVNPNLVSVRFRSQVSAVAARTKLNSVAGVDALEVSTIEITERNSAYVPLQSGISQISAKIVRDSLAEDPDLVYAEPVYQRSVERFGGTNRLIVKFADDVSRSEIDGLFDAFGAAIVKSLASGPNTFVVEVSKGAALDPLALSNHLIESYRMIVDYAHPDFRVDRSVSYTPNDPMYTNQWHLNSTGQNGALSNADVNAPQAWDLTQGSATVVIAVIDEGMQTNHPDLVYVPGWDAVGNDSNPSPTGNENHATAVAGVAAAKGSNGIGVSGACPNCKVMPIRLIVSGMTTADEAEAFNFAWQNGAAIINNSWGPTSGSATLPSSTKAAMDAATTSGRGGKGCVIFFAAGNNGTSMDNNGYANYTRVIAVAASTDQDLQSWYSSYGNTVDICAPSNGGNTTGITTTDRTGSVGYSSSDYTNDFGGTSSASPLAAGVAGLMLSANPNLTYTEVRTKLTETAIKIDQSGGNWVNGFSTKYGYGKVNAFAAVQSAQGGGGGGGGGTTQTFTSTNVPLSIPDNNTTGITSNLAIATTGTVNSVTCSVNITHTYRGDLIVTLIHPNNTSSILSNQSGGSADNIIQSFEVPAFTNLPLNGTWKLKVQDVEAVDIGTLNSWSLTINYTPGGGGGGGTNNYNFSSTNVPINVPDNNTTGITSNLPASATTGTLTDVNVTMNINHTWKGDLKVTLIHPDGTNVILHNRTGGSADNIITTYDTLTVPYQSLSLLNGKGGNGTWKLKVQDLASTDIGRLNSWSIQLTTATP